MHTEGLCFSCLFEITTKLPANCVWWRRRKNVTLCFGDCAVWTSTGRKYELVHLCFCYLLKIKIDSCLFGFSTYSAWAACFLIFMSWIVYEKLCSQWWFTVCGPNSLLSPTLYALKSNQWPHKSCWYLCSYFLCAICLFVFWRSH